MGTDYSAAEYSCQEYLFRSVCGVVSERVRIWAGMVNDRIGPRKPHRHFIRQWMKAKGITQERLADRMGISQSTVSKALKTRTVLTEEYLVGIAEALDMDSVADLFRSPDSPTQEELLRGLSDTERQTVLTMIQALRKAG